MGGIGELIYLLHPPIQNICFNNVRLNTVKFGYMRWKWKKELTLSVNWFNSTPPQWNASYFHAHYYKTHLWSGVISLSPSLSAVAAKLGHFRSKGVKGPKMGARFNCYPGRCTERLILAMEQIKHTAVALIHNVEKVEGADICSSL